MSRLCPLCTKNQGKRGEKRSSRIYGFFCILFATLHSQKRRKIIFLFFLLHCFFLQTREKLKTNFLTPRLSRCRGEESRARVKFSDSVPCAFHFCASCSRPRRAENFLFDDFPPKHLLQSRKNFWFRITNREHLRPHSRAAQRKLKILAPDAFECAFYLLNCYFFGALLVLGENVYNRGDCVYFSRPIIIQLGVVDEPHLSARMTWAFNHKAA